MPTVTPRYTDQEGRLILPSRFANAEVLVEEVSDTELRIRIAATEPDEVDSFSEEQRPLLADEDRDFLLNLLSAPPKANPALKKAAADHRRLDE